MNSNTSLAFFGERCGSSWDRFRWTGVYSVWRGTGQLYSSSCVWLRPNTTNETSLANIFGDCGVAPLLFPELPTKVCKESAASACLASASLSSVPTTLSKKSCSQAEPQRAATYQGSPCGPNSAFIQWQRLTPAGCSARTRSGMRNMQQQAQWLGQCGVPPYQAKTLPTRVCGTAAAPLPPPASPVNPAASPSPNPSTPSPSPRPYSAVPLGRVKLQGSEAPSWGMARVGAYESSSNSVVDAAAAIAASNAIVVTIDTGCDRTHPELNCRALVDFVDASSSAYYGTDGNGHGTHVAGIISAAVNGRGVTGVVPGMPLLALKVLNKDGSGMLSTIYTALAHVLKLLQSGTRFAAVNMSLTMNDGTTPPDASDRDVTCGYIRDIAAYGTAVVVAAGNSGIDMSNTLPGLCPEAIAVTALNNVDGPAYFSNRASSSSSAAILDTLIAAPGVNINSTVPVAQGSYEIMSGTSMAAPFVTGGFALCHLSGACKLSPSPGVTPAAAANYPLLLGAARAAPCSSKGRCGPGWGGSSSYNYGYMLNLKQL